MKKNAISFLSSPPCNGAAGNFINGKRMFLLLLTALFLLISFSPSFAETVPSGTAVDYSKKCDYRFPAKPQVRDDNKATDSTYAPGSVLPIYWEENVPVRNVFVAFKHDPVPFTLSQYDANGTLLKSEPGLMILNYAYPLAGGCRSLEIIVGESEMTLTSLYMYGEGDIPDFHPFKEAEGKLDYLIVATHCDDDVLFLGAIPPLLGMERGKSGTVLYLACSSRLRMDEGLNGAWTMGIRISPQFSPFGDVQKRTNNKFKLNEVTPFIVRELRKFKPDLVIGQDVKGEYGHWQHVDGVIALRDAVVLAADPNYDPESYEQYGAWQVKKLYLHLYPEDPLTLDINTPLDSFEGKTALEVLQEAFRCHKSQRNSRHAGRTDGVYDPSRFGLAFTTVGPDTPGLNDMLENIG